jgi:hypothetical protein
MNSWRPMRQGRWFGVFLAAGVLGSFHLVADDSAKAAVKADSVAISAESQSTNSSASATNSRIGRPIHKALPNAPDERKPATAYEKPARDRNITRP